MFSSSSPPLPPGLLSRRTPEKSGPFCRRVKSRIRRGGNLCTRCREGVDYLRKKFFASKLLFFRYRVTTCTHPSSRPCQSGSPTPSRAATLTRCVNVCVCVPACIYVGLKILCLFLYAGKRLRCTYNLFV